tara:strand:+ start:619 stop:4791 length:4173 start_codon:yes stop_codon:yes gene_type:complete
MVYIITIQLKLHRIKMAKVITEQRQFQGKQIGVVKASTAGIAYAETVKNSADKLTQLAVNEAKIEAQRTGEDLALSVSDKSLRTINPENGSPEAMSLLPNSYGTIAQRAFEDSVNIQFEKSIHAEINAGAKRAQILHPNDPDAYADAFQTTIDSMSAHATGRYKNIIDRYGAQYLASTKLNIAGKQVIAVNKDLLAKAITTNRKNSQLILEMYTEKAPVADIQSAVQAQLKILKTNNDAGFLVGKEYEKEKAFLFNKVTIGSLQRHVLQKKDIKLETLLSLSAYLSSSNDDAISNLDDSNKTFIPEQIAHDGTAMQSMSLQEYAVTVKKRLANSLVPKEVLDSLKGSIDKLKAVRTEENSQTNISKKNQENAIIQTMKIESDKITNEADFITLDKKNEESVNTWVGMLNELNKQYSINYAQTITPNDGTNASVNTTNYKQAQNLIYEKLASKTLRLAVSDMDTKKQGNALKAIRSIAISNSFDLDYGELDNTIKENVPKEVFEFIKKTHKELDKSSNYLSNFKESFQTQVQKDTVTFISVADIAKAKKSDELKIAKVKQSNLLIQNVEKNSLIAVNLGKNVDIFEIDENNLNLSEKIKTDLINIKKTYESNIKDATDNLKSVHNLDNNIKAKDIVTLRYATGLVSQLITDTDKMFTFNGKKRKLDKSDFAKIQDAIATQTISVNIPEELHPLIQGMIDTKSIVNTDLLAKSFEQISSTFDSNKQSQGAENAVKEASYAVFNWTNKKSKAIDNVVNSLITKETDVNKSTWVTTEPLINEEGEVNQVWINMVNVAKQYNRLPPEITSMLSNLANGRLQDPKKVEKAIQIYKLLRHVTRGEGAEEDNLVNGSHLIGNTVKVAEMDIIEGAINTAGVNENTTQAVIKNITDSQFQPMMDANKKSFFEAIKNSYSANKQKNRPKNIEELILSNTTYGTSNATIIKDLTPWADNLIKSTNGLSESEFFQKLDEKIENTYKPSTLVFVPMHLGVINDSDGSQMSKYALELLIPLNENRIKLLNRWESQLSTGFSFGKTNTTENHSYDIKGDQLGNTLGLDKGKGVMFSKDTPVYLMPSSSDANAKSFYAITTRINDNGQVEFNYIVDVTTNKFKKFTLNDDELFDINNQSNLSPLEIITEEVKQNQRQIDNSGTNSALHNKLSAEKELLIKKKNALSQKGENPMSDSNATLDIDISSDILTEAYTLLEVQEGFSNIQFPDSMEGSSSSKSPNLNVALTGATKMSIGFGFQVNSLTKKQRAMIKDINYITRPEAKLVLQDKIKIIRGIWLRTLKKDGASFTNFSPSVRIALISFGYQLDMTNVLSTKGDKAWPKFVSQIKEASKYELNSAKQKEHLKEAANHMMYNYDKNGEKRPTSWSLQTELRAIAMSSLIRGNSQ